MGETKVPPLTLRRGRGMGDTADLRICLEKANRISEGLDAILAENRLMRGELEMSIETLKLWQRETKYTTKARMTELMAAMERRLVKALCDEGGSS